MNKKANLKYVGIETALTILSAVFFVVGLIAAIRINLLAGLAICVASIAPWGYACLLTDIVEQKSPNST